MKSTFLKQIIGFREYESLHIKIKGLSVGIIFLTGFMYWAFIKGPIDQLTLLKTREFALKTQFESKHYSSYAFDDVMLQIKALQRTVHSLQEQLPDREEVLNLLDEIATAGESLGLNNILFSPQAELKQDFYVELPIKIILEGTYSQLISWLTRLSKLNKIINISEWTIKKPLANDNKKLREEKLVLNMALVLYKARDDQRV